MLINIIEPMNLFYLGPERWNISINTNLCPKMETKSKGVMTDWCLSKKSEPFPFFCTKCNERISPAPINQILDIMSFNPPLLSQHLSRPNSSGMYILI